jgi:hypothetical protein
MDLPDITILGWTLTDDQVTAGGAVLFGAFIALALLTAARRASSLFVVFLVTSAAGVALWSAARFGLFTGILSQFTR